MQHTHQQPTTVIPSEVEGSRHLISREIPRHASATSSPQRLGMTEGVESVSSPLHLRVSEDVEGTSIITLHSTCVGRPALLGVRRGEDVISGIRKEPLVIPEIQVSSLNILGDGQADLVNHGGVNKAVYCYVADHLPHWADALGYAGDGIHAPLGENLSVSGIDETTALIGDVWRWGDVMLQISQPRWPCYKLDMHTGIKGFMTKLIKSGYSGWYLRVLEPGTAPVSGSIEIIERDPLGVSVLDAFNARRDPKMDRAEYERIMSHPKLAEQWNR